MRNQNLACDRYRNAIISSLSLLFSTILFITSCVSDEVDLIIDPPVETKEEVDTRFYLDIPPISMWNTKSLTFSEKGSSEADTLATKTLKTDLESIDSLSVETRSSNSFSETEERKIVNLWVGQYNKQGSRLTTVYLPQVDLEYIDIQLKKSAQSCKVYFFANAGDLSGKAATEADLIKAVHYYDTQTDLAGQVPPFLMQGKWEGVVDGDAGQNVLFEQKVEMNRAVAKLRFMYTVEGSNFQFIPSTLKLCNIPQGVKLIESDTRAAGITFTEHIEPTHSSGSPIFWYLPENIAGEASGAEAVDSEKKKTGQGVTNATYIELAGDAVQNGHLYQNVVIRLYPGLNRNDYNIRRNHFYTIEIRLQGIDFSDQRVSVGQSPEPTTPGELLAEKDSETSFVLKIQPGKPWSFQLPDWLSALVNGTSFPINSSVSGKGQTTVGLKAVTANPSSTPRKLIFPIDGKEVTVTQRPSTLTAATSLEIPAQAASTLTATFSATKGIAWKALIKTDWIAWRDASPISGGEATGAPENLYLKAATSNPTAAIREGILQIRAGNAISGGSDAGLTKEVRIRQAASTVTGSTLNAVNAAKDYEHTASFTATQQLPWKASITSGNEWFSLVTASGTTAASNQVKIKTIQSNPNAATRNGTIKIQAGNSAAPLGPTANITVVQDASTLTASGNPTTLAPSAGTTGTLTFSGTKGLAYTITANAGTWLELTGTLNGTTTGGSQTIIYKTKGNNISTAAYTGTISIKAGNITKVINVSQGFVSLTASGSPTALAATAGATGRFTFNGTTGMPYSITSNAGTWLELVGSTTGTTTGANQTIQYKTKGVNQKATTNSGTITVTAGGKSKQVTITQAAATLTVSPASANTSYSASSGSFTVNGTNGLPLTYSSNQSWLTIKSAPTPANGTNQTATYSIAANSGSTRSAVITVKVTGTTISKSVQITQEGFLLKLPSESINDIPYTNPDPNYSFEVEGNPGLKIDIKSDKDWLKPSKSSVTFYRNTYHVSYRVDQNNAYTERTGTITVKTYFPEKSVTYTITQLPQPLFTVTPTQVALSLGGEEKEVQITVQDCYSWSILNPIPKGINISPTYGKGSGTIRVSRNTMGLSSNSFTIVLSAPRLPSRTVIIQDIK